MHFITVFSVSSAKHLIEHEKNAALMKTNTHFCLLWLFYVTGIRNATETRGSRSILAPAVTLRIDGDPGLMTKEVRVAVVGGVGGGGGHGQTDSHPLGCSSTHTHKKKKEKKLTFRSVLIPLCHRFPVFFSFL